MIRSCPGVPSVPVFLSCSPVSQLSLQLFIRAPARHSCPGSACFLLVHSYSNGPTYATSSFPGVPFFHPWLSCSPCVPVMSSCPTGSLSGPAVPPYPFLVLQLPTQALVLHPCPFGLFAASVGKSCRGCPPMSRRFPCMCLY